MDRERIDVIGICCWSAWHRMPWPLTSASRPSPPAPCTSMSKGYPRTARADTERPSRQCWNDAVTGRRPTWRTTSKRRGAIAGRLPRRLHDAARLPPACGHLRQRCTHHVDLYDRVEKILQQMSDLFGEQKELPAEARFSAPSAAFSRSSTLFVPMKSKYCLVIDNAWKSPTRSSGSTFVTGQALAGDGGFTLY